MAIFQKAQNVQAYLKMGLLGFAGSGKTYTATETAIGLVKFLKERKLPEGERPVYFIDTETGSSYVKRRFDDNGIDLHTAHTRAFKDLLAAIPEADKCASVLIVDSISHFWREFTEAYARKLNRTKGLQFQDWAYLKSEWGKFTDMFVNSSLHIILCGRAGYEYDFHTDQETGRRELEKTGIKMKAETEMGYEPSLLVLMERSMIMETKQACREANVLKERFSVIDGKTFKNPTFKDFMPHIQLLNLGGQQVGVDTSRTSDDMIRADGKPEWQHRKEQVEIMLDEIAELIRKHHSGQTEDAKRIRCDLLEKYLGSRAWKRIETMNYETIKDGRDKLWLALEGVPYGFVPPTDEQSEDVPEKKAASG